MQKELEKIERKEHYRQLDMQNEQIKQKKEKEKEKDNKFIQEVILDSQYKHDQKNFMKLREEITVQCNQCNHEVLRRYTEDVKDGKIVENVSIKEARMQTTSAYLNKKLTDCRV